MRHSPVQQLVRGWHFRFDRGCAISAITLSMIFCFSHNLLAVPDFINQLMKKKIVLNSEVASPESDKEKSNIDDVLKTLDETLTENRRLRQQIGTLEEEVRKIPAESSLLKSQIRVLQKQLEDSKTGATEESTETKRRLEEIQGELNRTREERKVIEDVKNKTSDKLKSAETEAGKLKKLLDSAILEEERERYLELLRDTQKSAESAVNDLADKTKQHMRMQSELSNAYYTLGNHFFQYRNYDQAIAYYEKALVLNPADAWSHHNLGVIHDFYLQDKEAAIFHYERYLNMKPAEEKAHEIRERLLELKLASWVIPPVPLKEEFESYTKQSELRETTARRYT